MSGSKRRISILLAAAICFAAVPAESMTAYAAYTTEDRFTPVNGFTEAEEFICEEFSSLEELSEYSERVKNGDVNITGMNGEKGVLKYLKKFDVFFLPEIFSESGPELISVYHDSVQSEAAVDGIKYRFTFFTDSKSGKADYDSALESERLHKNSSGFTVKRIADDRTENGILSIAYDSFDGIHSVSAHWKQEGYYMNMHAVWDDSQEYTENYSIVRAVMNPEQLMKIKKNSRCVIMDDIDLSDTDWKYIKEFGGTLDGRGHTVYGLTSYTYGLFGKLTSGAQVRDVRLEGVNIQSEFQTVGAIAGTVPKGSKGVMITGCTVDGIVASCREKHGKSTKNSTAGAIAGSVNAKDAVIRDCYSNAIVAAHRNTGGIAGINRGIITECAFEGRLTNSHNTYDLAAFPDMAVTDDYVYSASAGGICAANYGAVKNCLSRCTGIRDASCYGGIVGKLYGNGSITGCVNLSEIYADYECVGGSIAGTAGKSTHIKDCYTLSGYENRVTTDVGSSGIKTVTKAVKKSNLLNPDSFRNLDSKVWERGKYGPVPKSVSEFQGSTPTFTIKGGIIK